MGVGNDGRSILFFTRAYRVVVVDLVGKVTRILLDVRHDGILGILLFVLLSGWRGTWESRKSPRKKMTGSKKVRRGVGQEAEL